MLVKLRIQIRHKQIKKSFGISRDLVLSSRREIFEHIVLELRTNVLKNRESSFWVQCSQYQNKMVILELVTRLIV